MLRSTLAVALAAATVAVPAAAQAAPGDLDPTFGTGGVVLDAGDHQPFDVARTPDGGTVIATRSWQIIKLRADGSRDPGFGTNGQVDVAFSATASTGLPYGIAVDSEGRVVVVGSEGLAGYAVRLRADGDYDSSFGDPETAFRSGRVQITLGGVRGSELKDVVIDPDDRLTIVGTKIDVGMVGSARIVRLTEHGDLDDDFAGDGIFELADPEEWSAYYDRVVLDPNGRVYAGGTFGNELIVTRVTPAGVADPTFAVGGPTTGSLRFSFVADAEFGSNDLFGLAYGDQGVFVAGRTSRGASSLVGFVARLTYAGAVDPTFPLHLESRSNNIPGDIAAAPDGGVLAVDIEASVLRLTAAGAPDPQFGEDGRVQLPPQAGAPVGVSFGALVRGEDDTITAVGAGRVTASVNALLAARFTDVGGTTPPPGTGGGTGNPTGGGSTTPPPASGTQDPQPQTEASADPAATVTPPAIAAVYRPSAWFHRVPAAKAARTVTVLNGEADQGAAAVQVSVRRRDGEACRPVTSARTARLARPKPCAATNARWLPAQATLRKGRTQTWTLRFGAHLPAGRYTATVRALDGSKRAGTTRSVTFRIR
jgi:uncharacterized delta-60 repeat protein